MSKAFTVLILIIVSHISFGQGFNFLDSKAIQYGVITSTTFDPADNNIYVTGYYSPGSGDFDTGAGVVTLPDYGGDTDCFIAKYSPTGNLIWAKGIGGNGTDVSDKIILDQSGNVYVAGSFDGSLIDLDPDVGDAFLAQQGQGDGFIVKLNSDGTYGGGFGRSTTSYDAITGIDFDDMDRLYITGTSGYRVFFERYSSNASVLDYSWILSGTSAQYGKDIFVKTNGNILITGTFSGTADFDPDITVASETTNGYFDLFFAEYDKTNGSYANHWIMGGVDDDEIYRSVLDPSENLIISGYFNAQANFDPNGTFNLSPVGDYDFFVAKYTSSGNLAWAVSAGGSDFDIANGLNVNSSGEIFVTGQYYGDVDFDPTASIEILSTPGATDQNGFLMKLSSTGNLIKAINLGDSGPDSGDGLLVVGSNLYLFAGFGSFNADVDPNCNEVFPSEYNSAMIIYEDVSLAPQPSVQPAGLTFTNVTTNSYTVNITDGSEIPDGYLALMSAKAYPDITPVDGREYCSDEQLGTNGSGEIIYVVFNSSGNSFNIDNISPPEVLLYRVYAFNGSGASINYFLTNPLQGVKAPLTAGEPTTQVSDFASSFLSNTQVDLSWTKNSGTNTLILIKEGSPVDELPVDNVIYNASETYGLGDDLNGNYVVYNGTESSITVEGLTPGTTYYAQAFAFNSFAAQNYLTSTISGNAILFTTTNFCSGDITGPDSFTITIPSEVDLNANINVSADISDSDGCPITDVKIYYAALEDLVTDDPLYTEGTMTAPSSGGEPYTFAISGKTAGIGVTFNIEATNMAQLTGYSDEFSVAINIPDKGYSIPYNSFGSDQSNYRIVSVPLTGSSFDNKINSIFDELGSYDKSKWRMYQYSATGGTTEMNGNSTMSIGRGYWFIAKDNPGAITVGGGTTPGANLYEPFAVNLTSGWNLIGNPYNFDIKWADILGSQTEDASGITSFKVYQGGIYVDGTKLEKFSGGFVLSSGPFALEIPAYRNASIQGGRKSSNNPSRITNSIDQFNWEVRLNAESGGIVNTFGGVGMNPEASEEFDKFDDLSLPRFLNYIELVHDNPAIFNSNYSRDVVPPVDHYVWDFTVESNTDDPIVELSWDNSYFGSNNKQLYLWDEVLSKAINMRIDTVYSLDKNVSKNLQIIYGDENFVKEKVAVNSLVFHNVTPNPVTDRAVISFSVPEGLAQQEIELSTFDLLGRRVWDFNDQFEAGYYEVEMKIDNTPAKGLYLVRIKSGKLFRFKRILIE